LAYDRDDHVLYLADTGNHCVRRIDLRSRNISRVAGSTVQGFAGDDDDALGAELDTPTDVAYDIKGDVLYICDRGNHRIRALAISTGVISTFAGDGNGAFGGDGGAPDAASLHTPVAIAVDGSRNVYVATIGDHRVRKIEYSAAMDTFTVSTLAGTGVQGNTGDGGAANAGQLDTPSGVAVDDAGAVYISCTPRARVRKVQDGVITTLVGTGVAGFAGDGGLPIASQINGPQGLAVDSAGRKLFIADTGNRRVRRAIL
jgi:DNA-binding beta-propeller fold protein YncE